MIYNIGYYITWLEETLMKKAVCMFGDSVARGVAFDSVLNRYLFLKDSTTEILKNRLKIKIDNYSKFGCTVIKGKEIILKHEKELPDYAYIGLEFGGNDCDFDWEAVSKNPGSVHYPKTPLDVFERVYSEIIRRISENGGRPVLFTLPPINADKYFKWITKGLNAANILKWLGDIQRIYRWHELYSLTVSKIAGAFRLPLIDIRAAFLESSGYQNLICEDGIHPNENGHMLISAVIEDRLKSALESAAY